MTRGIHLKHLTGTDLGLLGLPEDSLTAPLSEPFDAMSNAQSPGPDWVPDLRAITREVCAGLEETLHLLSGPTDVANSRTPTATPKP